VQKYKINGDASIMIGIPTETIEEAKETLNFVKKYKPDVPNVKFFNPLPGCSLFDWCVEKGMLKKPTTLEEWALWTGNYRKIKHNLSKIPDRLLAKFVTKSWNYGFYSGKLKKFIYWMKIGEYRYAFKGIKRVFITRGYLKIPFLGVIKRKAN